MGSNAALDSEVLEAMQLKTVQGRRRLRDWIPLLKELARADERVEAAIRRMGVVMTVFVVLTLILIFATIFSLDVEPKVAAFTGIGIVISIAAIVAAAIRQSKLKARDLPNEIRGSIIPLLEALEEDIDPKGKITIDCKLELPNGEANQVSRESLPTEYNKLIETVYRQRCCTGTIPLRSGAELSFCIDKQLAKYDRYYTSIRGKRKHKCKWKALTTVEAAFAPQPGQLSFDRGGIETLASSAKVKRKEKQGREVCRLVRRFKDKSETNPPQDPVSAAELVGMFMSLCNATRPATQMEANNA